jgi:hypothetical protein
MPRLPTIARCFAARAAGLVARANGTPIAYDKTYRALFRVLPNGLPWRKHLAGYVAFDGDACVYHIEHHGRGLWVTSVQRPLLPAIWGGPHIYRFTTATEARAWCENDARHSRRFGEADYGKGGTSW